MEGDEKPPRKELLLKIPKQNPQTKQALLRIKLSKLLDPQNTEFITTKKLPFDENSTSEYIINQLIANSDGQNIEDRKSIKEVIRIWHPDKFSQMYHQRIDPDDKDGVIRVVTHISQALLNFGRQ